MLQFHCLSYCSVMGDRDLAFPLDSVELASSAKSGVKWLSVIFQYELNVSVARRES